MDTQELGMRIRKGRMEKQMKQTELASRLSVSPTTLCKWEKGTNRPNIESLKALSAILEVPLMTLLGESTPKPESPLSGPVPQTPPSQQGKAGKPWTRRLAIPVVCLLLLEVSVTICKSCNEPGGCEADIWRMPRGVRSASGAWPAPAEAERRPHTSQLTAGFPTDKLILWHKMIWHILQACPFFKLHRIFHPGCQ